MNRYLWSFQKSAMYKGEPVTSARVEIRGNPRARGRENTNQLPMALLLNSDAGYPGKQWATEV